jgi:hypothetical protein
VRIYADERGFLFRFYAGSALSAREALPQWCNYRKGRETGAYFLAIIRTSHGRQQQVRFRLHCGRFGIRRERVGPPADREGLPRCGDGDGAALDAGESAGDKLVTASVVLASEAGAARLFQHAILPARDHSPRMRGGRRLDYVCHDDVAASRKGVGHGPVGWAFGLEARDAAALRHGLGDAGRGGEPDPGTRGSDAAESGRRCRCGEHVLSHARGGVPGNGRNPGRRDRSRSSAAKVPSARHARRVADA